MNSNRNMEYERGNDLLMLSFQHNWWYIWIKADDEIWSYSQQWHEQFFISWLKCFKWDPAIKGIEASTFSVK